MRKFVVLMVCLSAVSCMVLAQNHVNCIPDWVNPLTEIRPRAYNSDEIEAALLPEAANKIKYMKMDFWFTLRHDGSGGLTKTGDNHLDLINGYELALKVVEYNASVYASNGKLNIPPNNNIPVKKVPVRIIINKIHFIANDSSYYDDGFHTWNTYVDKQDSVFSCVFYYRGNGGTGYSSFKLLGIDLGGRLNKKKGYYSLKDNKILLHNLWGNARLLGHEFGHSLGLDHTLLTGGGSPYRTSRNPTITRVDRGDGCDDTPSAVYMVDTLDLPPADSAYAKSRYEYNGKVYAYPNCAWGYSNKLGCSNNLMDYNFSVALSPCQIERMVKEIASNYQSFKLCRNVGLDNTISKFGYPQVSYYGKNIKIEKPVQSIDPKIPIASSEERQEVYFSESVEINSFEFVEGDKAKGYTTTGAFEVKYVEPCP